MGLFSALFGSDETVVTAATTANVTVNPETNIVNVLDLEPIQKLVDGLSDVQRRTADAQLQAATVTASSQERIAAEDRARSDQSDTSRNLMFALMAGVSLLTLAQVKG